jgi:hypothetical protein
MPEDTTRSRSQVPPDEDVEPNGPSESAFGDLSGAAREAVRSPADPRLDAHLARLGLTDGPPTTRAPSGRPAEGPAEGGLSEEAATRSAMATELERLRAAVAGQETSLAEARDRVRLGVWLGSSALVVGLVALLLALIR